MRSTRLNLKISAQDRYERILFREKKLRNEFHFDAEFSEDEELPVRKQVFLEERNCRIIVIKDGTSLQKKVELVIQKEYPYAHIFQAENMTQALIEMEQREYDLIVLDIEKQNLFADYFVEVMQQRYAYINIMFLGGLMPIIKSKKPTEGKYIHIPEQVHKRGIERVLKSLFQRNMDARKNMERTAGISPVDKKFLSLRHSA